MSYSFFDGSIEEGGVYLDVWGKKWEARYNPFHGELQLWRADVGFGLWCAGENIVKKIV